MTEEPEADKCPQCGRLTLTDGPGGGEVCAAADCDYWFCY